MATATATRPFITGFCGRRNPQDSHRRCPTTLLGLACTCDCHTEIEGGDVNAAPTFTAKDAPKGTTEPVPGVPASPPCPTCGQPWTGAA